MAAPPGEETEQAMDVDNLKSPITASDDAILSSTGEAGVEVEMATLWVTSTSERHGDGEGEDSG